MTVGQFLRKLRIRKKASLRSIAASLCVEPAYLSRVERGLVTPSNDLLRRASRVFACNADALSLLAGRVPAELRPKVAESLADFTSYLKGQRNVSARLVTARVHPALEVTGKRAIEDSRFSFERLSQVAEIESWRKEVNRPIYHLHKWWAKRLGSVFRGVILGTFAPSGAEVMDLFYQPARVHAVIFDPFMGSGTTIGEALKVGARAIGRDINPVAYFAVKNALSCHSHGRVVATFHEIERDIAPRIRHFYQARLDDGSMADVLYYFWVKTVPCPRCHKPVELFSSRVFAQHAYPKRNAQAKACCPHCGSINETVYDSRAVMCSTCGERYDPRQGAARGTTAQCPGCSCKFPIGKAVKATGQPPGHHLYAKMVLRSDGTKQYLTADAFDRALYEEAQLTLATLPAPYPTVRIMPGYNTDQVLSYCYEYWHQMFNERQLLCLGLLGDRIRKIREKDIRELFICLFSGVLEFNNMFASFKGEGTGAVRHMFAHHILKPERMPLEANLWGTPKSSGAFSTLFHTRLLRALEYAADPFEVRPQRNGKRAVGEKVFGLSQPLGYEAAETAKDFRDRVRLYLSCGDSSNSDLADRSVDAVITDPPFFDNVHYSQLADFFYVWQRHLLGGDDALGKETTRSAVEVQNTNASEFTKRLTGVWRECRRVLKDEGLLVFTYHHSRPEGWEAVLRSLIDAGFVAMVTHPIKAEMSVAVPKQQAKEPIDFDMVFVCRKRAQVSEPAAPSPVEDSVPATWDQIQRLREAGYRLSRNDVRIILVARLVVCLSACASTDLAARYLTENSGAIEAAIDALHVRQETAAKVAGPVPRTQLDLFVNSGAR
jgi:transcriptional regulator with XRE-family HTH domain